LLLKLPPRGFLASFYGPATKREGKDRKRQGFRLACVLRRVLYPNLVADALPITNIIGSPSSRLTSYSS
jgi:hypothetical protein